MSKDLPSSEIRDILFEPDLSDVESDLSIDDFPDSPLPTLYIVCCKFFLKMCFVIKYLTVYIFFSL